MGEFLHIVCPNCDSTNRVPSRKLSDHPRCGKCKNTLFHAHPMELTGASFSKHVSNSQIPIVVDFWAAWCGPCKMMAPVFEQAAVRLEPHVRLAKVNTEVEQGLSAEFNIRSIPTVIIFKEGREIARQSGAVDLGSLIRWVESYC